MSCLNECLCNLYYYYYYYQYYQYYCHYNTIVFFCAVYSIYISFDSLMMSSNTEEKYKTETQKPITRNDRGGNEPPSLTGRRYTTILCLLSVMQSRWKKILANTRYILILVYKSKWAVLCCTAGYYRVQKNAKNTNFRGTCKKGKRFRWTKLVIKNQKFLGRYWATFTLSYSVEPPGLHF